MQQLIMHSSVIFVVYKVSSQAWNMEMKLLVYRQHWKHLNAAAREKKMQLSKCLFQLQSTDDMTLLCGTCALKVCTRFTNFE